MGYVMVPVPEEHVEEAMQVILRITSRARLTEWEADGIAEMFQQVDEPTRAVLSCVARSVLTGEVMSDVDVSRVTELPQREILSIVREVNEVASAESRLAVVIMQMDVQVLPNGRTRDRRVVTMSREVAEMVGEAEKAELRDAPHPLLSDGG